MKFTFKPMLEEVCSFNGIATIKEFSDEKAVFSADPIFAVCKGGPLTRRIITAGENSGTNASRDYYPTIDTRVHRLMPGMFPAIPGWHCDDVPREHYEAQPDLTKIDPNIFHYTALIATSLNVCNTEFVIEDFTADLDPGSKEPLWSQVHRQVERERPRTKSVDVGKIYKFNQTTIHRAVPAVKRGWRLFFRLSLRTKPQLNQETGLMQVYMLSEENGW